MENGKPPTLDYAPRGAPARANRSLGRQMAEAAVIVVGVLWVALLVGQGLPSQGSWPGRVAAGWDLALGIGALAALLALIAWRQVWRGFLFVVLIVGGIVALVVNLLAV